MPVAGVAACSRHSFLKPEILERSRKYLSKARPDKK
jgi:hypothetical protein